MTLFCSERGQKNTAPHILATRLRGICQNDPAKRDGAESSVTDLQSLPFLKFANDGMLSYKVAKPLIPRENRRHDDLL